MIFYNIAGMIVGGEQLQESFQSFETESEKRADCVIYRLMNEPVLKEKYLHTYEHTCLVVRQLPEGTWHYIAAAGLPPVFVEVSSDYHTVSYYLHTYPDKKLQQEQLTVMLRFIIECRCIYIGKVLLSLHASAVEYCGEGLAFSGKSGIGKSTRAGNWVNETGANWISGDRPMIGMDSDTCMVYGVPWDGKEKIYRKTEVPLKAILEVRRALNTKVRKISQEQLFCFLVKQCFIPMWDTKLAQTAIGNIRLLSKGIQAYRVFGGPQVMNAHELKTILYERTELIMEEKKDITLRAGFKLNHIAGEYLLMPVGENIKRFDGAVVLNETSAFVCQQLEKGISREDLLALCLEEYDVSYDVAAEDLDKLLKILEEYNILNK